MNTVEATFPIKEATIYPSSARIIRARPVSLKKGVNRLIIGGLPDDITEHSIRLETGSDEGIEIKDIYSEDIIKEGYDTNVYRKEQEKLEQLVLKKEKLESAFSNFTEEFLLFLNKESFTSGILTDDVSRKMEVKNWEDFFSFLNEKLTENRTDTRKLLFDWIELKREIDSAESNLQCLESYDQYKEHKIVALLEADKDNEEEVRVIYLQPGVSWYPAYTLRADIPGKKLLVNLFGMICQATGEDWEDISIHLSTAVPMESVSIPEMRSKRIKERDTSVQMVTGTAMSSHMGGLVKSEDELDMLMEDGVDRVDKPMEKKEERAKTKVKVSKQRTRRSPKKQLAAKLAKGYVKEMEISQSFGSFDKEDLDALSSEEDIDETTGLLDKTNTEEAISGKKQISIRLNKIEKLMKSADLRILPSVSLQSFSSYYELLYMHLNDIFVPESRLPTGKKHRVNKYFLKGISPLTSIGGFDYRYDIPSKINQIPSSDVPIQTSVVIKDLDMELIYTTIPVKAEAVYMKGVFKNQYNNPFPAGPAQVFADNNFLGNISFPTIGLNQGSAISLGVERDIKVIRKEKSERKTGGLVKKGILNVTKVEIEVVSHKKETVTLEVIDRVPISQNKKNVQISNISITPEPLKKTDRNIVVWKVKLEPGKKKVFKISYQVKHPEDFRLTLQRGSHPYLSK